MTAKSWELVWQKRKTKENEWTTKHDATTNNHVMSWKEKTSLSADHWTF